MGKQERCAKVLALVSKGGEGGSWNSPIKV